MKVPENECLFLFNGTPVQACNVVAYCHSPIHHGWMTKNIVKKHQCVEKDCNYLEKVNSSYWNEIEFQKQKKIESKEKRKQVKEERRREQERNEYIRSVLKPYKDIHVTAIKEINYDICIFVVRDKWVDVRNELKMLCQKYRCTVYLKTVKR